MTDFNQLSNKGLTRGFPLCPFEASQWYIWKQQVLLKSAFPILSSQTPLDAQILVYPKK